MKYLGFLASVTLLLVLSTRVGVAQELAGDLREAIMIAEGLETELSVSEVQQPEPTEENEHASYNLEAGGLVPRAIFIVLSAGIILGVLFMIVLIYLNGPDMEELNLEDDLEYARDQVDMNNNEITWRNQHQRHGLRRSL